MITHVASAGENGGRVIVQFCDAVPNPIAIDAAYRIAQLFGSEIEGLLVEKSDILALSAYPFTREISLNGKVTRNLDTDTVARDMRLLAGAIRKHMLIQARAHKVPCAFNVVGGDPVAALAQACQSSGPWNVVALADAVTRAGLGQLQQLLTSLSNTTGVVICGPKTCKMSGPIIVVTEQIDTLPGMLRTAERLSDNKRDIILLMIAQSEEQMAVLEGQMRLALGAELGKVKLAMSEVTRGEPVVLAEVLRRLDGGFIIGQFGGQLLSPAHDARALLSVLRCPVLITR